MAAVGLPAAVGLALHRVIRDPGAAGGVGDRHGLHYLLSDHEHAAEADRARTVDGTIRHPDHIEEPLRRAEGVLDIGRSEGEGAPRVVAPECIDLALDDCPDLDDVSGAY